jgi:hypothetical protein
MIGAAQPVGRQPAVPPSLLAKPGSGPFGRAPCDADRMEDVFPHWSKRIGTSQTRDNRYPDAERSHRRAEQRPRDGVRPPRDPQCGGSFERIGQSRRRRLVQPLRPHKRVHERL